MEGMNILSLTYLGNIQWFSKLCFSECIIDLGEHYLKQSYRNRCEVLTAGGRETLSVNVVKGSNLNKPSMSDVRIDYSKRWQHLHRQTIVSAYGSAPYFEHYWPELAPYFDRQYDYLAELNTDLLAKLLSLLKSTVVPRFSHTYIEPAPGLTDLRDTISPKPRLARPDPLFVPQPYWQVFASKENFQPNLSILDLLFCEGPLALSILRQSAL